MAIIEKTDKLLEQIIYCDFRTSVGVDKAKQYMRKALREQDRDTRHACAEKVASCVDIDLCHDACMNCNDGL